MLASPSFILRKNSTVDEKIVWKSYLVNFNNSMSAQSGAKKRLLATLQANKQSHKLANICSFFNSIFADCFCSRPPLVLHSHFRARPCEYLIFIAKNQIPANEFTKLSMMKAFLLVLKIELTFRR